jgi:hypothetical protein
MSKPQGKPTFYLAGHEDGPPTLDQLIALAQRLTGRDPTPEEIKKPDSCRSHFRRDMGGNVGQIGHAAEPP